MVDIPCSTVPFAVSGLTDMLNAESNIFSRRDFHGCNLSVNVDAVRLVIPAINFFPLASGRGAGSPKIPRLILLSSINTVTASSGIIQSGDLKKLGCRPTIKGTGAPRTPSMKKNNLL